jgi:cytoskeleton protein RodZ
MADIGSTLRETRIREKIDITAVETATKIRAKYLRALENEEWMVLPGPTYVKSFLRTYAEFLGLDAHMLVEEYRARYEQPEELELPAFASNGPLRGRVRPPGPPTRAAAITALALAFVAVLFVLGITGDGDGDDGGSGKQATSSNESRSSGRGERSTSPAGPPAERPARKTGEVTVSVVAERPVWVCLVDAEGKPLIGGRTLTAGKREGPFRSSRFRVTLGNSGGDLRVNGKLRQTPDSAVPLGYALTASGTRPLSDARRPTCAGGGAGTTGASGAAAEPGATQL